MYSLIEIKAEAAKKAAEMELNWDVLDANDPNISGLMDILHKDTPKIEEMYTRLCNGESIVDASVASPLPYEEIEETRERIADSLYRSYLVVELWNRYNVVCALLQETV